MLLPVFPMPRPVSHAEALRTSRVISLGWQVGANGFQHGSVTTGAAFLGEAMGTYLLCYVVLESAVNSRAVTTIGGGTPGNLNLAPIAIGLVGSKRAALEQESLPFLGVLLSFTTTRETPTSFDTC